MKQLASLFILQLIFSFAFGQVDASKLVKWEVEYDAATFKKGKTVPIIFKAKIMDLHHVYGAEQPSKAVMPLRVNLKESLGIVPVSLKEEGKRVVEFDDVFGVDVAHFSGEMKVVQTVKITKKKPLLKGSITFQVCNETMCLPGEYRFELK